MVGLFNGTKAGSTRHHWLIIGWSARKTARWSSMGGTEMGHSPHGTMSAAGWWSLTRAASP